ncbi:MAG TPA: penicillin-binding transpeptidase domain-containing protein, partial [Candidatus Paceibacterota bacterium]|nr:penicillin-binding transpeptidase domain-containing protein [Candidatus Paceibacterota bacterium]
MGFFRRNKFRQSLDPDEIFLDASNLPSFDNQQFEGRIEKPISKWSIYMLGALFALVGLVFAWQTGMLQIARGAAFAERSENNHLRYTPIFSQRGVVYDRNNVELAWNDPQGGRTYIQKPGFAHLLGYLGYPTKEQVEKEPNRYSPKELVGKDGVEEAYENLLAGQKGIRIEEIDVSGEVTSNYLMREPEDGKSLRLSIDARIQEKLYGLIESLAADRGFGGGAATLMDVQSGEVLALVSFPEYDSNVMTKRTDGERMSSFFNDSRRPFLNRAVSGLYTPGSIFKPIMALAALEEGVISPEKKILSTGSISIINPYDKTQKTVFKDWKAHGWTDMREALAVSSDVYFYEIGGGYPGQVGIGIKKIDEYSKIFGLSKKTGIDILGEATGVIPTPEWKEENFDGEPWRIGNTYHTSIGQYGFQVTPVQMVRATAVFANKGHLLKPTLLAADKSLVKREKLDFKPQHIQVVKEGMRLAVTQGTAKGLSMEDVSVAAKTGTAELGAKKQFVNSWVVGFFPY